MKVELVSITRPEINGVNSADELIAYCARVINPSNQLNSATAPGLIKYLIKNKHWSHFEMASMCVSIETSRAIAAQILRHRSFSFQEFSQRYSEASEYEDVEIRCKAETNRQSSEEKLEDSELELEIKEHLDNSFKLYEKMLDRGVATECARFVLPLDTKTKLYMNGTLRSWIHYLELRLEDHTQKEHRLIAEQVLKIVKKRFPTIYKALYETT